MHEQHYLVEWVIVNATYESRSLDHRNAETKTWRKTSVWDGSIHRWVKCFFKKWKDNPNNMGPREFFFYTWKRQIREGKMNAHHLLTVVPLGTGKMVGGEVNFCTWLKSRFFSCVPVGQRWEEARGNRSRINQKIKRGHANHCVCQVEVMEQRRTGGTIKEGGFRRWDD